MAWYQHQMNFNENAFCGNEWVLTFTGARDSPGRRLAPVQGHSTELGNTSQTTVNETKLPGIQGFKETDESMHGSRANPFLLLGHPALATRPIVRMRGQLNVKVNIQDGVKQGTYWKIQGVSAVRQILKGDTMSKGRIWMSVVGVGKCCGCWKGQGRRVPQEVLSRSLSQSLRGQCVRVTVSYHPCRQVSWSGSNLKIDSL